MEKQGGTVRLQKFLADAGVAARRAAEDLVLEGRVKVNGRLVDSLPAFVDPEQDDVRVDGQRIRPERKVYYLLNKPKGVPVGNYDPAAHSRLSELLAGVEQRVFPVGRLDEESDGVLIMTNDGDLAQKLTHPRYGAEKVFRVEARGQVSDEAVQRLRKGMWFSEGRTPPAWVEVTWSSREMTILEITMRESLHRQIPRMLARLGYKVKKLSCIRIGRLTTKGMRSGEYRPLKADETRHLKNLADKAVQAAEAEPVAPARPRTPRRPSQAKRPSARPARRPGTSAPPKRGSKPRRPRA